VKTLRLVLFLIPALLSLWVCQSKASHLEALEARINSLEAQALLVKEQEGKNTHYLAELKEAPLRDQILESLPLLETEGRRVQVLYAQDKENLQLKQRLEFLKSGKNRISFTEEKRRTHGKLREIEEKLARRVEMNEEDLQTVLPLLEPRIIREFDLTKQMTPSEEEVYSIDLKVIKREVL
jgi:hypothetical protein